MLQIYEEKNTWIRALQSHGRLLALAADACRQTPEQDGESLGMNVLSSRSALFVVPNRSAAATFGCDTVADVAKLSCSDALLCGFVDSRECRSLFLVGAAASNAALFKKLVWLFMSGWASYACADALRLALCAVDAARYGLRHVLPPRALCRAIVRCHSNADVMLRIHLVVGESPDRFSEECVRHWTESFVRGAPMDGFEHWLDTVLTMLTGEDRVLVAQQVTAAAKAIALVCAARSMAADDGRRRSVEAAASTLGVSYGGVEALALSIEPEPSFRWFVRWAVACWTRFLEWRIQKSFDDATLFFRGATERVLAWDIHEPHAEGDVSGWVSVQSAAWLDGIGGAAMEGYECALTPRFSTHMTEPNARWWCSLWRRLSSCDGATSLPPGWLEPFANMPLEVAARVSDVRTVLVCSDPSSSVVKGYIAAAKNETVWSSLDRQLLWQRRLVQIVPALLATADAGSEGVDGDENAPYPTPRSLFLQTPFPFNRMFSHHSACGFVNQMRLLLIALNVRFVEHCALDETFAVGDLIANVDAVLYPSHGVIRWLRAKTAAWLTLLSEASALLVHLPRVQAALRAKRSLRTFVSPLRHKRISAHVVAAQAFLRSKLSMYLTNSKEFEQTLSLLDYAAEPVRSFASSFSMESKKMYPAAPQNNLQLRVFARHVEGAQSRYRCIIEDEEQSTRQRYLHVYFRAAFPLLSVVGEERARRERLCDVYKESLLTVLNDEESQLRDRVETLWHRSLRVVLQKCQPDRLAILQHLERVSRKRFEVECERLFADFSETSRVQALCVENLSQSTPSLRTLVAADRSVPRGTHVGDLIAVGVPTAARRVVQQLLEDVQSICGKLLLQESRERRDLVSRIQLEELVSRESIGRSALWKQFWLHCTRRRLLQQRERLFVQERIERVSQIAVSMCQIEELVLRRKYRVQENDIRQALLDIEQSEAVHLRQAAMDWEAVCTDAYLSPTEMLNKLRQEQRMVQHMLLTMSAEDARRERRGKEGLRMRSASDTAVAVRPPWNSKK